MQHSESIKEIAPALVNAQKEIKAAIKESANPFFKSKYADLASIIEAVRIPLNNAGISFLQPVSEAEHGVKVETILLHTSGEWLSESLVMPVSKDDAQGVGSAITYARRYGLQSMCGVPVEDDDGNAATLAAQRAAAEKAAAEKAANRIVDLWTEGKEFAAYEEFYEGGHSNDLMATIWGFLKPHSAMRAKLKLMKDAPDPKRPNLTGERKHGVDPKLATQA